MVYECKVKAIVMLANFYEDNPPRVIIGQIKIFGFKMGFNLCLQLKCIRYWDDRNKAQYGNIIVKVASTESNFGYTKTKFILTHLV